MFDLLYIILTVVESKIYVKFSKIMFLDITNDNFNLLVSCYFGWRDKPSVKRLCSLLLPNMARSERPKQRTNQICNQIIVYCTLKSFSLRMLVAFTIKTCCTYL